MTSGPGYFLGSRRGCSEIRADKWSNLETVCGMEAAVVTSPYDLNLLPAQRGNISRDDKPDAFMTILS